MKTLRAILGVALVVGGTYYGYLLIPPYFNNYQLQDYIESEALMGVTTTSKGAICGGSQKPPSS